MSKLSRVRFQGKQFNRTTHQPRTVRDNWCTKHETLHALAAKLQVRRLARPKLSLLQFCQTNFTANKIQITKGHDCHKNEKSFKGTEAYNSRRTANRSQSFIVR